MNNSDNSVPNSTFVVILTTFIHIPHVITLNYILYIVKTWWCLASNVHHGHHLSFAYWHANICLLALNTKNRYSLRECDWFAHLFRNQSKSFTTPPSQHIHHYVFSVLMHKPYSFLWFSFWKVLIVYFLLLIFFNHSPRKWRSWDGAVPSLTPPLISAAYIN